MLFHQKGGESLKMTLDDLISVMDQFESRIIRHIENDKLTSIDYQILVSQYRLIQQIKKAVHRSVTIDWPKDKHDLDSLLKPGKIF